MRAAHDKSFEEGIKHLTEMALNRTDAIDRCVALGKQFIMHFIKILEDIDGVGSPDFEHYCDEMQAWLNSVNSIILKQNNKPISNSQLMDWFFTAGSSVEELMPEEFVDIYENFIIKVLAKRKTSKTISEIIIDTLSD